ncbi:hypothetical protein ACWEQL_21625 [Kitasatospora sp. NPDC004240]
MSDDVDASRSTGPGGPVPQWFPLVVVLASIAGAVLLGVVGQAGPSMSVAAVGAAVEAVSYRK